MATKMKSIVATAHEVQALLDGRKTQLTVPIKPQPELIPGDVWKPKYSSGYWIKSSRHKSMIDMHDASCAAPYAIGDRLAVKETYFTTPWTDVFYKADSASDNVKQYINDLKTQYPDEFKGWRSPVVMPLWAARIFLEVTSVEAVRLQDVTEEQARAERVNNWLLGIASPKQYDKTFDLICKFTKKIDPNATISNARGKFAAYWNSRYAKKGLGWDANPWCWRFEVKTISREEHRA